MEFKHLHPDVIKFAQSIGPLPVGYDGLMKFGSPYVYTKDTYLSNYYIEYKPQGFVAEIVAPRVPVPKLSGYVLQMGKDNFRRVKTTSGWTGEPELINTNKGTDVTYKLLPYALGIEITAMEMENADIGRLRESKINWLKSLIALDREIRVATELTTQGNWAAACTSALVGTAQWNNLEHDDAKPLTNMWTIKTQMRGAGSPPPTHLVLPSSVRDSLMFHTDIISLTNQSSDRRPTLNLPANIMEMQIVSADSLQIATVKGQADTFSDVWGKHAVALHIPSSLSMYDPYRLVTFAHEGTKPEVKVVTNQVGGGGYGSEMIYVVEQPMVEVAIANYYGYFLRDVIA